MKAKRTFPALIPVLWVIIAGGLALAQTREPIRPGSILTLEACLNRSLGSHPLLKAVEIRTEAAEVYASFDTGTAAGQFANVTDTVEQLTGHKPTRFADFVNAHRDEVLGNTAAVH